MRNFSLLSIALLIGLNAPAVAGEVWRPIGPERGHVVEAASTEGQVFVVTRVGVMRADSDLDRWTRDPRFPRDTAMVRTGTDGSVWAAARGCVWRINGDTAAPTSSTWSCFEGKSALRDLVPRKDDVIALVRGEQAGIYAVTPDGARPLETDVDPWVGLSDEGEVWIGTLGQGLWRLSQKRDRLEQVRKEGSITGLGKIQGDIWAGDREGRVFDARSGESLGDVSPGWATHLVEHSNQALLFAGGHQQQSGWFFGEAGAMQPVTAGQVDEDFGRVDGTGVWALPNGKALMGTFRRGPLTFDGGTIALARNNFRATVTGGSALDSEGHLLLGLMGTGVYRFDPTLQRFTAEHGRGGPVTDTVYIGGASDGALAIDFSGVTWRKPSGRWTRLRRPTDTQMVRIAGDEEGRFWALGQDGRLYRYEEHVWTACETTGVVSLDGPPDGLVAQTTQGLVRPQACTAAEPKIGPSDTGRLHPSVSVAAGDWLASSSGVWWRDRKVAEAQRDGFKALWPQGEEALIGGKHQLYRCTVEGCSALGPRTPSSIAAVGALESGQPWVLEDKGTLLLLGGTDETVNPWSRVQGTAQSHAGPRDPSAVTALRRVPWSREGLMQDGGGDPRQATGPNNPNAAPPPPHTEPPPLADPVNGPNEPRTVRRILLALLGGALGVIAAWRWSAYRRRKGG